MIAVALDPAALPIGVAGRGPATLRRFVALQGAGARDLRLFCDRPDQDQERCAGDALRPFLPGRADLDALRILWIAGLPDDHSAELAALARSARVAVNVEDRPELCDFHSVAEVRRGDLLLTVSTGGASPGLAARIRSRLATEVRAGMGGTPRAAPRSSHGLAPRWTEAGRGSRADRCAAARQRVAGMTPDLATAASRLMAPVFEAGTVWLVGAGPGDPGLLTLHAAHALAEADIVLHDALVSPDILALAPRARLEPVGKRAGGERTPQLRISERLIRLAREGHRVVRLKGGDPLVFGRGAEEALALAAAGVRFRIVPGVSAGIGGTASAGIPTTHRGLAHSVAFATGHDAAGELPADLDWDALARGADVLVLYMALRRIGAIAARLRAAGRDGEEPVAFITEATTPRQRVVVTTLALAEAACAAIPRNAPTLIVVGPVVALRPLITAWQDAAPMSCAPAAHRATA